MVVEGSNWWRDSDSNRGHEALQATALPTELSRRVQTTREPHYHSYYGAKAQGQYGWARKTTVNTFCIINTVDESKNKSISLTNQTQALDLIAGGGVMSELIRTFNWSKTCLGPITDWQQSLRSSVNIILHSPVPMVMLWGTDGIMIYNDAYSVFAGARHPSLLGSKVEAGWPEVADFNRNVLRVGLEGKTLSYKDQELILYRNNRAEQVWMDLNYSPVFDDKNNASGILAVVVETTQRVVAEKKQKQTEEFLKVEREQFQMMADNIPNLAWIADAKGWIYW